MLAAQRVLVIGLARSGLAAIHSLHKQGAQIMGYDQKTFDSLGTVGKELEQLGVQVVNQWDPDLISDPIDLIVVSPGVPLSLPIFEWAHQQRIPIIGELELAYRLKSDQVDLLAVTGTNGKTTTTALLRYILEKDGRLAYYGGNIGIALTSLIENLDEGVVVVEVSSFQLETVENFRPPICGLLNITPDHLDRHKTMEAYIEAKSNIFKQQLPHDYAVFNYDDHCLREIAEKCPATVVFFSAQQQLPEGFFINNDVIVYQHHQGTTQICPVGDIRLRGQHNLENVLCAVAMSYLYGAKPAMISDALKTFTGVRHRMEEVIYNQGVLYVNDSKATNPESVMKALESFQQPIILIAGGRNKGSDFAELAQVLANRVRDLILLGEARQEIKDAVMKTSFRNIHEVSDLTEAVELAARLATVEDVVLLSPACASWDQFPSYEHRGDLFCKLARSLAEQSSD
jgi:UDP-N-acetylmuramoylalanine--D-glutamate ligase